MPTCTQARAFCSTVLSFPEPQGTYLVSCSSVSWFLTLAKIERRVHWLNTLVLLPRERFTREPLKHYFVVNVL